MDARMNSFWGNVLTFIVSYIVTTAVLSFLVDAAHAAPTYTGSEGNCNSVAQYALNVAAAKEEGLAWKDIASDIDIALDAALANPRSYIKTSDDVNSVRALFKQVYDDKTLDTGERVYMFAYNRCMGITSMKPQQLIVKGGGKGSGKAKAPKASNDGEGATA